MWRHQVLDHQQVKLLPECQEVREKGVEVRFDGEVEDLFKVCVVEMGEDSEEVFVDVFGGVGEGCREVAAWLVALLCWGGKTRKDCRIS